MAVDIAALRIHPALAVAAPATLRALARVCRERVVEKRDLLARAGSAVKELILVVDGALDLSYPGKRVLLGHIEAPTLFGDASAYGAGVWPVSARAAADGVVVLMPPRALDRALNEDCALAAALYREVCRRHYRNILLRRTLVLHETSGQILDLLSRPPAKGWTVTTLARSLGVDRVTVWRRLKKLIETGAVVVDEGTPRLASL